MYSCSEIYFIFINIFINNDYYSHIVIKKMLEKNMKIVFSQISKALISMSNTRAQFKT